MKKVLFSCVTLVGFAALLLPYSTGCLDCDLNGTLESFLVCNNRTLVQAKSSTPADFQTDGEPPVAEALD